MIQPFPQAPAAKQALHRKLQAEAPDVLAAVAELRHQFPAAKLTYIKTESVEYGSPLQEGASLDKMDLPIYETPEQKAAKARLRTESEKRRTQLRKKR